MKSRLSLRTLLTSALALALWSVPAVSQEGGTRQIETVQGMDYFGFDLRAEQNRSLEECKSICLADEQCRAFTYNERARWCFLKSDFRTLNPFPGAVGGKVIEASAEPTIGAPEDLSFVPDWMRTEARQFRAELLGGESGGEEGLGALSAEARQALANNDAFTARDRFEAAIRIAPEDGSLWRDLAQAALNITSDDSQQVASAQRAFTGAALAAYELSRTASSRSDALLMVARALDRRELFRPALQAYEASLALADDSAVRSEYEDLKARKGFRIVQHTVDADTASPRVCAEFSEDLAKTGTDYAQFVRLDDRAPASVEATGRQICVGGLAHGRNYRIDFRAGLPAAIGEALASPVALNIYVRDRAPSARFTGDSFVLPAGARRGVPLVSVNMDVADVKLFRVGDRALAQLLSGYQFLRQLDGYQAQSFGDDLGQPVWEGQIEIANEPNAEVTTSFPLDQALPERKPGVYVMTATPPNDRTDTWEGRATQWLVVSDIGLSTYTGEDGLNVFARSLDEATPLANVALTLLARSNEVLGEAVTDDQGRATFTPGSVRGTGSMVPAVLMARGAEDDFVFLDMTRAGFDLSDRGVAGRDAPGALDVFTWTERGIYRAGETVHAAALARDSAVEASDDLPLTFIFSRPDGAEERRTVSDGRSEGGHAVDLPLQSNAMRGTWSYAVHTDPKQPAVARGQFLVEDFVPDRIEFDLSADKTETALREPVDLTVDGRFLYGAPAAGLELEGDVTLSTKREWTRFPGFQFGLADEEPGEATRIDLADLPVVGEDGKAQFPIVIDEAPSTTRLVNARVAVRMRETGGRAVERTLDVALQPETDLIGIRPEFGGSELPQGATARFSIIAASPDGERKSLSGLRWSLVKVERNYQWYRANNSWAYEPITTTSAVANGMLDAGAGDPATLAMPVDWGRYRLEIETDDPAGPATSVEFDAGWYVAQTSTETPDGLEIALDKASYKAGETARLQVSPRFAGELLVTIGAERLLAVQSASIPAGGGTVEIPVGSDWGAGAYVTATLFRPGTAEASRMPARAIGVKWLGVDAAAKTLSVSLSPPEKTEPRQTLSVPVKVAGAGVGTEAFVTVAAVDVGILNLTRYEAPNPEGWFFGQRKLRLELRDLYGRLIDGSLGTTGRLRTGGDGGGMTAQGKPPTEKLVAFFSGIVRLDENGEAQVGFDIPQFNGTVRVMAVAWTREAVGHAQADVIVRDPVVLTAGLPRFLAPGDRASMRLDFANTDGPAGDWSFAIEAAGAVVADDADLPETIQLEPGRRQTMTIPLTALQSGDGSVTVRLAHADGAAVEQTLSLPVRPAAMPVTTRTVVDLAPGASLRIDAGLLAESDLDGASIGIGVSRDAGFDVASLLLSLDRYPYGCAEQTTSRALPLLYVNELSAARGMAEDPTIRERIQESIDRVLAFQASSGSFGLWSPGYGDLWLDAYVTDFLTRAREAGYRVPSEAMLLALNNLQNGTSYDLDLQARGNAIAYAFYVLARNKKASIGDLRYYSDTQIEAFQSPMAVAHLAASLALYGDRARSEQTFEAALALAKSQTEPNLSRNDYGSRLRDGAAILALAAESRPEPRVVPELIGLVSSEHRQSRWTSTQEQSWMLLAARALKSEDDAIRLDVNGEAHEGALNRTVSGEAIASDPTVLANRGTAPVQAVVTAVAAPAQPLPAGGDGFTIERTTYTLDGAEANVTEAKQNERFVVVLRVTQQQDIPARVLVTDLLPAGFEIDNPGLVSSASLTNFDWLPETQAAHLEFRDDRFVAAFNRGVGETTEWTLAYVVRAVTPGTYAYPAAQVEDMYRPEFSARTAAGMMAVVE
ncbi:MAG: hypothetical protein DI629_01170 [Mesorhizobium amorphae]|nr:MAG: hypothetical protein DI629_01170 [Mesorhizobium amorphae]